MKKNLIGCLVFVIVCALALSVSHREANAQGPSSQSGGKTAGEVFKNIQVMTDLKDKPSTEFLNTMSFISASLSVSCNYCHTPAFDSDAKKTKQIAREMIKMMRAINENNFGGRMVVTCNTCHQGNIHPKSSASPWYKTPEEIAAYNRAVQASDPTNNGAKPATTPEKTTATLPTAEEVIAHYRKTIGYDNIKSIHMSGTTVIGVRGSSAFEINSILPDKIVLDTPANATQQIINGDRAWRVSPTAKTPLTGDFLDAFKSGIVNVLPIKFQDAAITYKVTGVEMIGGRSCYVVQSGTGDKTEWSYFDAQSGLLLKSKTEISTAFGKATNEITFEDYRDINGAKLPYIVVFHYLTDQVTYQIAKLETNTSIDPVKFDPPAQKERKIIAVDPKILCSYAGEYEVPNRTSLTFICEGNKLLFVGFGGQQKLELFPETETDFFLKEIDAKITFIKNDKGQVTAVVIHQGNIDQKFNKKN